MRDYARRRPAKSPRRGGSSGPLWFIAGLGVGLLATVLVYFWGGSTPKGLVPPPAERGTTQAPQRAAAKPAAAAPRQAPPAKQQPPAPQFEFYTVLPEMEVVVPDQEVQPPPTRPPAPPAAPLAAPPAAPVGAPVVDAGRPATGSPLPATPSAVPPAPSKAESYMLQVGSFRRLEDADRLKARLALLGVRAGIQKVTTGSGETWHRVRLGPYSDLQQLDRVRGRLKQNGINTLLVKMKG